MLPKHEDWSLNLSIHGTREVGSGHVCALRTEERETGGQVKLLAANLAKKHKRLSRGIR